MQKTFTIEGSKIRDIDSFYQEINRLLMAEEDWKIGNSLDAFNDILYGGVGALQGATDVELIWLQMEESRKALGYEATKAYYLDKLAPESSFNKPLFQEKLAALENGTGQTYFDVILEIIAEHPKIKLIAK